MYKYYTQRELVLRGLWAIAWPFFRFSPRLCYGWRNFLLRIFGATIGANVKIFPSVTITLPWLLEVGDNTVIGWNVRVYNIGRITIGSFCVISQFAHLCGGTHDYHSSRFSLLRTGLSIGDHVWIAADAFVGPRVRIGDRCIVAARAVVVRSVDDSSIVAGNPAIVIRRNIKGIRFK